MKEKILIVEDEFIVAHDLQLLLESAGYEIAGIATSAAQALQFIEDEAPDFALLDIYLQGQITGVDLAQKLRKLHLPFIFISANSNESVLEAAKETQPYGFIVKPYKNADVLASIDIARYRHRQHLSLQQSGELYLEDYLKNASAEQGTWEQKTLGLAAAFQPYLPFDFVAMSVLSADQQTFRDIFISRIRFNEYRIIPVTEFIKMTGYDEVSPETMHPITPALLKEGIYTGKDFKATFKKTGLKNAVASSFSVAANLVKSLKPENGERLIFSFYSQLAHIYKKEHLDLLHHLEKKLCTHLSGMLHSTELQLHNDAAVNDSNGAQKNNVRFEGIAGNSPRLLHILDQVNVVAATDTSILITGESGTGKEKIAQYIHKLSNRSEYPMITINCAALPANLIESILFGHERGAFTGATDRRIGKFEEANNGTVFLDEIGEMPFELQKKLLRVLQEREIERVGSSTPIPINIRLIAATNRFLEKEIAAGKFRLDLYYRLNVFPIHVPPLQHRKEDIPLLANYFIAWFCKKAGIPVKEISTGLLNTYAAYDWPGNIRELENLIERSILLTKGPIITQNFMDNANIPMVVENIGKPVVKTIEENERDHIIAVLKKCNGRIAGEGGAAELLGIPTTTLNSKIKRLGIKRG